MVLLVVERVDVVEVVEVVEVVKVVDDVLEWEEVVVEVVVDEPDDADFSR